MNVDALMCREVVTCGVDEPLEAAARLLWDHDVGVVPVVRGQTVVGVVTDRDICMAAYTRGRLLREIPVSTAMSRGLYFLHPEDALEDALRVMRERQVRRLPVVDDERRLLGLLSINDLVREAASGGRVVGQEVLEALAAIGEARPGAARRAAPPARA